MQSQLHVAFPDPANERLTRLLAFADDVLSVCDALGMDPILDGSMAVRAITQNRTIIPHDIDLNCPEVEFPALQHALQQRSVFVEIQPWHVLQARRGDLKVEFGAIDVWLEGITGPYDTIRLGNRILRMVNRQSLRELYQRGFDATAIDPDEHEKHNKIGAKIKALEAVNM